MTSNRISFCWATLWRRLTVTSDIGPITYKAHFFLPVKSADQITEIDCSHLSGFTQPSPLCTLALSRSRVFRGGHAVPICGKRSRCLSSSSSNRRNECAPTPGTDHGAAWCLANVIYSDASSTIHADRERFVRLSSTTTQLPFGPSSGSNGNISNISRTTCSCSGSWKNCHKAMLCIRSTFRLSLSVYLFWCFFYTEAEKMACTWFGEICYCCS